MPQVGVYLSEADANAGANGAMGEDLLAVIVRQQSVLQQQLKKLQDENDEIEKLQTKLLQQTVGEVNQHERRILAIETRLNLERKFKSSPPRSPR